MPCAGGAHLGCQLGHALVEGQLLLSGELQLRQDGGTLVLKGPVTRVVPLPLPQRTNARPQGKLGRQ